MWARVDFNEQRWTHLQLLFAVPFSRSSPSFFKFFLNCVWLHLKLIGIVFLWCFGSREIIVLRVIFIIELIIQACSGVSLNKFFQQQKQLFLHNFTPTQVTLCISFQLTTYNLSLLLVFCVMNKFFLYSTSDVKFNFIMKVLYVLCQHFSCYFTHFSSSLPA